MHVQYLLHTGWYGICVYSRPYWMIYYTCQASNMISQTPKKSLPDNWFWSFERFQIIMAFRSARDAYEAQDVGSCVEDAHDVHYDQMRRVLS